MEWGELNLGQIQEIVDKLGGMDGVNRFLSGNAEVVFGDHVIDCDADPFIPNDWEVEEHRKGGKFVWGASAVTLFLPDGQKSEEGIEGNELRKEMANQPTLNANVLDYLLANPYLIPQVWQDQYVCFWGTIYRYRSFLFVRSLYNSDGWWRWGSHWLDYKWRSGGWELSSSGSLDRVGCFGGPAALRAS